MKKISTEMALLLHSLIAQESGGSTGIRDLGLLDSALQSAPSRPLMGKTYIQQKRRRLHVLDTL